MTWETRMKAAITINFLLQLSNKKGPFALHLPDHFSPVARTSPTTDRHGIDRIVFSASYSWSGGKKLKCARTVLAKVPLEYENMGK
jgi:hypothetical protein